MHFLVFVPGTFDVNALKAVGLGDIHTGSASTAIDMDNGGPEGLRGILFGWRTGFAPPLIAYRPDEQEWVRAEEFKHLPAGRYWVGFWKNDPPTPGDLLKGRNYGGNIAALGDDLEWTIPACKGLPHAFGFWGGEWSSRVTREFEDLVIRARYFESRFVAKDDVSFGECLELAYESLCINYRLTREVVTRLQLFTGNREGTLRACLMHCIGAGGEE